MARGVPVLRCTKRWSKLSNCHVTPGEPSWRRVFKSVPDISWWLEQAPTRCEVHIRFSGVKPASNAGATDSRQLSQECGGPKDMNDMDRVQWTYVRELRRATSVLPRDVRRWMGRAIGSGWFRIAAGDYDGGPGASVCPFVAAAMMAGVWSDGGVLPGNPDWGVPDGPTPEIEDFAAYFDLCADMAGVAGAIATVAAALEPKARASVRAA